jgi:DNA (cytosine-5)-methyltransferase 1
MKELRIRKLTPKEYWRLQGFTDEDFEKAKDSGLSNSQLYKQAGNSICVPVVQGILKNLLKAEEKSK